ncbi:uncharacterized protein [Anabrus simplex]|uniref:uncharacterized protein n=1 Tax=Anabrus simplex TaxID=316456 RepID=UPI0034DD557C
MTNCCARNWLHLQLLIIATLLAVTASQSQDDSCGGAECGLNARCANVKRGEEILPICECIEGYTGDSYIACKRGFGSYGLHCRRNEDCPLDSGCFGRKCRDPCEFTCITSDCIVRNHLPVCINGPNRKH